MYQDPLEAVVEQTDDIMDGVRFYDGELSEDVQALYDDFKETFKPFTPKELLRAQEDILRLHRESSK